jgi:hypothetical protein
MNISTVSVPIAPIKNVNITDESLSVDLADGRSITVPISWYPRLSHGKPEERKNWRLIGNGEGIHWPDLDEDVSVDNIVLGQPSGESQTSFSKWLKNRQKDL